MAANLRLLSKHSWVDRLRESQTDMHRQTGRHARTDMQADMHRQDSRETQADQQTDADTQTKVAQLTFQRVHPSCVGVMQSKQSCVLAHRADTLTGRRGTDEHTAHKHVHPSSVPVAA